MNKIWFLFIAIMAVMVADARRLRIGPAFAYAMNIPGQNSFSIRQNVEYDISSRSPVVLTDTQFLYGINDKTSVYLSLPFIWFEKNRVKAHGFASLFMQGEYAFLLKQDNNFFHQMTIFSRIFFPTTTTELQEIRASKAFSFFFGATHSLMCDYWHAYAEAGYIVNLKQKNDTKLGNVFTYNLGLGRFIVDRKERYLIVYAQLTGIHSQPDKGIQTNELGLPNNIIFLGASLKGQINNLIIIAGFQYPLVQRGTREDERFDCRLAASIRYFFS